MASEDTTAGRLHQILVNLRVTSASPLVEAWSNVLGVDVKDRAAILRGISLVVAMPDAIEETVRSLPDVNHDLLLRWRPKVSHAMGIAHHLEQQATQLTAQYDDATLLSLEHAADTIARVRPTLHLEPDRAVTADDKISELLDALESLDATDEVRQMLVRHALRLQGALRLYRVSGPEAVKDALVDATAALAVATTGQDDDRPAVRLFGGLIGYVADSLQIVTSVTVLYPQIEHLVRHITG